MKKIPYRLLVLLSLIQEIAEYISDETIHKLLFIYCHKYSCNGLYDFISLHDMPYNFQIYEDRKSLAKHNILINTTSWQTVANASRFATNLNMLDKLSLQKLKNDLAKNFPKDNLWQEAFDSYNSVILEETSRQALYTIGYEGVSLEAYLNKLLKYGIKCLCDVRRNPYSQKYGFSKNELKYVLSRINIDYIHIPELGISSALRKNLKTDSDYYGLLREYDENYLPKQGKAIGHLKFLLEQYQKLAITCFEAKLATCHRSKLAELMRKYQYQVKHI